LVQRNNDATPSTTSCQVRRDRRRVRTTDHERTRASSVGSTRTLRSERTEVALVVHVHEFCPAPCRPLRAGPASSKAGFSLQAIRSFRAPSCLADRSDPKDAPHQLLQPTPEPSTLWTVRFPRAPIDEPCGPSADCRVKLRLTASFSFGLATTPRASMQDHSPDACPSEEPARSWWSFDRSSSAQTLPAAALSTAHRARGVASDVLCRSHPNGPDFTSGPRTRRQAPGRPPLRQKRGCRWNQDAFPRQELPPPLRLTPAEACASGPRHRAWLAPCLAEGHGLYNSLHRDRGVSTGDRLPASFHHPSTRLDGQTQADSWRACGSLRRGRLDRTSLVDFCNQNSPRAQPCDRSIPGASFGAARPACAELGGNLRKVLGPLPPRRPSNPGNTATSLPVRTLRLDRDASVGCQPRFHEPEAGRLSPPGASRPPARKQGNGALPRLDPLGHLLSRDRGGTGGRPQHRAPSSRSRTTHFQRSRLANRSACRNTRRWVCVASARPASARPSVPTNAGQSACADRVRPFGLGHRTAYTDQCRPSQGPRLPEPREELRNRLRPRCLPSMSYRPDEPRLSPKPTVRIGHSPQVVPSLWKTHGAAFRLLRGPTVLTYRGRTSPCLPCDRNWAETQNIANWAAGLTPVAAPASQRGRARELIQRRGGLCADMQRSHRLLRSERSTV
jgi:hypothetical protein